MRGWELSPAQYLQGRVLRDQIPVPTGRYNVFSYDVKSFRFSLAARKSRDKYYHNEHAAPEKKLLVPGEPCYYKTTSNKYSSGKVMKRLGSKLYVIKAAKGDNKFRRNRKHVKAAVSTRALEDEELSFPVGTNKSATQNVNLDYENIDHDNCHALYWVSK